MTCVETGGRRSPAKAKRRDPEAYILRSGVSSALAGKRSMAIEIWLIVEVVTIVLSIPVFALSYYWVFLLGNSLRYPRGLGEGTATLAEHPVVSILIAAFNERYVIERSLEAMKGLEYPKEKLQVVVADDSDDQTREL